MTDTSKAGTVKIGDFTVNRMGFGAMRLTGDGVWGGPADREQAKQVLREAVAAGVNFIDTADSYGPEVSENIIAEALQPYDGLVIATKGGKLRPGPNIWHNDCSPGHLRQAVEGSLKRLGVEQIYLYQLHAVDERVDYRKSIETMMELKESGKIRHIGLSNVDPENLKLALEMTEIASVQNRYNVFERDSEEVLRVCEENDIVFIPYFPLGAGRLAERGGLLAEVAAKHQAKPGQIALAWLLARSPVILPIPGTSSLEHLRENITAADIRLNSDDLRVLNRLEK